MFRQSAAELKRKELKAAKALRKSRAKAAKTNDARLKSTVDEHDHTETKPDSDDEITIKAADWGDWDPRSTCLSAVKFGSFISLQFFFLFVAIND